MLLLLRYMNAIEQLEKRLWNGADQLRANSGLTSTQYSMPVLGLIFLRHASILDGINVEV